VRVYSSLRKRLYQRLVHSLKPCRQIVPLLSKSLERQLSIREWLVVRLHLLFCAWCVRYLKQVEFIAKVLRAGRATNELAVELPADARERILTSLKTKP
jgi:hypothetical protein